MSSGAVRARMLIAAAGALAVALIVLVAGSSGSGVSAGAAPPVVGAPEAARSSSGTAVDPSDASELTVLATEPVAEVTRADPEGGPAGVVDASDAATTEEASAASEGVEPSGQSIAAGIAGSDPHWIDVLTRLDRARAKALTKGDRTLLSQAVQAHSPAWKSDLALLQSLQTSGLRPSRLRTTVVAAVPLGPGVLDQGMAGTGTLGPGVSESSQPQEQVTGQPSQWAGEVAAELGETQGALDRGAVVSLLVTDRRAGYELVDGEGSVVKRIAEAPTTRWRVRLVAGATDVGWLVSDVRAVP